MNAVCRFLIACSLALMAARTLAAWPEVSFPPDSKVEAVGDRVRLNGVPMRMFRVLSSQSPKAILKFYRDALGEKHIEHRFPEGRLLAQEKDHFFTTVRIRAIAPNVTEVLFSISDRSAVNVSSGVKSNAGLPDRSLVISDMESVDGAKQSRQLVFINEHTIGANAQQLLRTLRERGYEPDEIPARSSDTQHVQLFKGEHREAMLTMTRKDNKTQIVLTTITDR